jgi:hypothetical protein
MKLRERRMYATGNAEHDSASEIVLDDGNADSGRLLCVGVAVACSFLCVREGVISCVRVAREAPSASVLLRDAVAAGTVGFPLRFVVATAVASSAEAA